MIPPRVFISYSHDSADHKKWVLDFATTLRNRGIDAVIDQWELKPGDDLPHFMETQIESADFIIMVCTQKYVDKANAGEGGVGYEKMIMTSSLLAKIDNSKVIPIIKQSGSDHRPTFLKSKLYINFSNDEDIEYSLDELLRTLLKAPLYEKPPIGTNPFKPLEGSHPDRTADGLKELMITIADCFMGTAMSYVYYSKVVSLSKMHRLSLDRYVDIAIEKGLIRRDLSNIYITKLGTEYLFANGIIEE